MKLLNSDKKDLSARLKSVGKVFWIKIIYGIERFCVRFILINSEIQIVPIYFVYSISEDRNFLLEGQKL